MMIDEELINIKKIHDIKVWIYIITTRIQLENCSAERAIIVFHINQVNKYLSYVKVELINNKAP
jgi:hypothetical protein